MMHYLHPSKQVFVVRTIEKITLALNGQNPHWKEDIMSNTFIQYKK
jgi:hypothetical protein